MSSKQKQKQAFTADVNIGDKRLLDIILAPINNQVDNYTLVLSDASKYIRMGKGSSQTLTIPLSSVVNFPINTEIAVEQSGAGTLTLEPALGVTLNSASSLILNGQYAVAVLKKVDTNVWTVTGRLT